MQRLRLALAKWICPDGYGVHKYPAKGIKRKKRAVKAVVLQQKDTAWQEVKEAIV